MEEKEKKNRMKKSKKCLNIICCKFNSVSNSNV